MKYLRVSLTVLIFTLLVGQVLAQGAVSRTPWEMHTGLEEANGYPYGVLPITWNVFNNPYTHGHPTMYNGATIPGESDGGWGPAPNAETIAFGGPYASVIDDAGYGCWQAVDYTYFQTFVNIPCGTSVNQFTIQFSGMDDGSRITIYNSANPNGLVLNGSYVYLGATGTTDLSSYVISGEVNRVVVTQVDDCPVGNNLASAVVLLNGGAVSAVTPQEFFADALSGPSSPHLEEIDFCDYNYTPSGLARVASDFGYNGWTPGLSDRPMVKTAYDEYLNGDFRAEVTVSRNNSSQSHDLIYFGFGAGDPNPGYHNEPTNSFYFRIHQGGGNSVQAVYHEGDATPVWVSGTNIIPIGTYNNAGTTFRIDKCGDEVTLSIVGGGSATFNVSDVAAINSGNGHVFFGNSAIGTTFSDFVVAPGPEYDVWDSSDPNNYQLVGRIYGIESAQSGAGHYNYYSASAHPSGVNLGANRSNLWLHENTNTGDLTFGFVFGVDNSGAPWNTSAINFRIIDSDTNPWVSQSDDPGEAVETPAGSDAFIGNFYYANNTDGIAVSGISGDDWTIIVQSVNFGPIINQWFAADGYSGSFADDISLTLGNEYRITPKGNSPSGAPVLATNQPPFADAGEDQTIDCVIGSTDVTLSGSASSDPDDDELSYSWTLDGNEVSTDESFSYTLSESATFTLTVSDGQESNSASVTVTVNLDTEAPDLTVPEDIAVANDEGVCGAAVSFAAAASDDCGTVTLSYSPESGSVFEVGTTEVTVTATDEAGNSTTGTFAVTVTDEEDPALSVPANITQSNDEGQCNAVVSFAADASDNCEVISLTYDPAPGTAFEVGTTEVTVTATDAAGNSTTDSFEVTVVDDEAPELVGLGEPLTLWPPNHQYVAFNAADFVVSVGDNCSDLDASSVVITHVTSDEVEDARGGGDGNTDDDILFDGGTLNLRAERQGGGNGRVYTVYLAVMDDYQNESAASVQVHVPHNRKRAAIDDGAAYTVEAPEGLARSILGGEPDELVMPEELALSQNYPNPFNPSTTIAYAMPASGHVSLVVYDLRGSIVKQLVNDYRSAGYHTVSFNASDLPAGTYMYVMETNGERFVNRMMLIK